MEMRYIQVVQVRVSVLNCCYYVHRRSHQEREKDAHSHERPLTQSYYLFSLFTVSACTERASNSHACPNGIFQLLISNFQIETNISNRFKRSYHEQF